MKHLNAFQAADRPNAITHTPWMPSETSDASLAASPVALAANAAVAAVAAAN